MSRFEVKDIHISDILLQDYKPYCKLNIQVQYNFRDSSSTQEEIAKELGDVIAKAFLDVNGTTVDKEETAICPTGWHDLNDYNQKIVEETERAYKAYEASKQRL